MEHIEVRLDTTKGKMFDTLLQGLDGVRVLKDGGDLVIAAKNGALQSGRAGAVLCFSVDVDGTLCRAQTVVTLRLLISALRVLQAAYTDEGLPRYREDRH